MMTEQLRAIVDKDGIVQQIVVWDGVTPWAVPAGSTAVPAPNTPVQLGMVYDHGAKVFNPSQAQAAGLVAGKAAAATLQAARPTGPVGKAPPAPIKGA